MSEVTKRRPTGLAWVALFVFGFSAGMYFTVYIFEKNCNVLGKFRIGSTAYNCEIVK